MSAITAIFIFFVIASITLSLLFLSMAWIDGDGELFVLIFIIAIIGNAFVFGLIGGVPTHYQETKYVETYDYHKFDSGTSVSLENPFTKKQDIKVFNDTYIYNTIDDSSKVIEVIADKDVYGTTLRFHYNLINKNEIEDVKE